MKHCPKGPQEWIEVTGKRKKAGNSQETLKDSVAGLPVSELPGQGTDSAKALESDQNLVTPPVNLATADGSLALATIPSNPPSSPPTTSMDIDPNPASTPHTPSPLSPVLAADSSPPFDRS